MSAGQLTRARPTERLAALLERTGCDPNLIGIEITETAILPDVKAAAREIAAARELGIKVALDDFGTGHSSLTLLRSLPIDRVKIDQTFVRELTRDARDAAIVRSVITLASDLGLEVVAEGVETPEQARAARASSAASTRRATSGRRRCRSTSCATASTRGAANSPCPLLGTDPRRPG